MHTRFQLENLMGRHYLGDLNMDGKLILKYIVTCRVVRVTKIAGSSSDDWIY
jgi:hypothetical protein